ncbi:MAG: hypothetical protein RLZ98_2716 [Pseudomonadota bacterium]|jgi:hypothetical protein
MSTPEALRTDTPSLEHVSEILAAAVGRPENVDDAALRNLLAVSIRLYAAKAEGGMRTPLPTGGGGVTVDEIMLTVTDLLHAQNVQLFELSMWQAMSGNCIAPHQRLDTPDQDS